MKLLLCAAMLVLLLRPIPAMEAVSEACRLFVASVMPGLLPYMVLSQLLLSRLGDPPSWLLIPLGWCGGSPAGAQLAAMVPGLTRRDQVRIAVTTSTMSPMFLVGVLGGWLGAERSGWVLLISVLLGGWLTGRMAWLCTKDGAMPVSAPAARSPLTFGEAVERTARMLLLVCGTMAVWRMFAFLASEACPWLSLPLTALLEVTTGLRQLAQLGLPLGYRTALMAGAAGMGGLAILLQNRAVMGAAGRELPLGVQLGWQLVHGGISFLLALGLMQLQV